MIDWKTVDPRYFEKFTFHFLKELGFRNREWFGRGGGDRGRDVCATWYEELPFGMGYQRKWIFQCKRWKTMPSAGEIYEEISKAVQHQPDHWVMVIPLDPTTSIIDYFINMERNFGIKLSIIPLSQLEEIIVEFPYLLSVLTEGYISERGGANEVRI